MRAATESAWHAQRSQGGQRCITAGGLSPGTKYFFRARVGAAHCLLLALCTMGIFQFAGLDAQFFAH